MKTRSRTTKSKALQVNHFEVKTPWVRVQVYELKMIVDYLLSQNQRVISGLGDDVERHAVSYQASLRGKKNLDNCYMEMSADLKGRILSEITIVMSAEQWAWVKQTARLADVEPATVVRYGLYKRWRQISEFNRSREKTEMEARAATSVRS